jgi:guanylate kinase
MSNSQHPHEHGKDRMGRRGLLVVISSPSGAGKTTLCKKLMEEFPVLKFSVSYTTRPPRTGERNGVDYNFVDGETFDKMVAEGEFAEWAEVHGNRYGTTRAAVAEALNEGRDVLFDVDWQGGRQIKAHFGSDAVLIWILPPSLHVLEERLKRRATDAADVIQRRLEMAKRELEAYGIYDYIILNDDLDKAYGQLRSVYVSSHLTARRAGHEAERLVQQVRGR